MHDQNRCGQMHHEGCWRIRTHHACAVAEVERLRADCTAHDEFRVQNDREWRSKIDYQKLRVQLAETALATARAEVLKDAAALAGAWPTASYGDFEARLKVQQATTDIAAGIRTLKDKDRQP